jgi:hypothetical protein
MSAFFTPASTAIRKPVLAHGWRDGDGQPYASVDLDEDRAAHIVFSDPAEARELAGQIIAAAMWLEVAIAESPQAVSHV